MLHYLRTFLFSLALVLSMTQVPAMPMGQTESHQMMNHAVNQNVDAHHLMTDITLATEIHSVDWVQERECIGSNACVHCATNAACMNHCATSVAVPALAIYKLPENLPDQYALSVLSINAFFFNQPNTPPPKIISFS